MNQEYNTLLDLMQNHAKEWYFGNLTREEAQQLILSEAEGSYLIRDCNQIPGSYVLMVKERSHSNKYVIASNGDFWKIGNFQFDSIESLLTHYTKTQVRQSMLTNPVPKPFYRATKDYRPTNDLELEINEGDGVKFVLKYDNKILCQEKSKSKRIGWLPADILKQSTNDGISVQQMVFRIQKLIPFKSTATKGRNPSVFDKQQLQLKIGDILSISDVSEDGMLKATKDDGKEGFVPFNIVRLPDFKGEM